MAPTSRPHGRAPDALRPVSIIVDPLKFAEGSALIELGDTRVLVAATVEKRVPSFLSDSSRGWATAEYAMLPRATATRSPREGTSGRPRGRSAEIQRLIGRSLRAVLDLAALPERTLTLDCDVLQADGGTRAAAITGAGVALALACRRLVELRILRALPLTDSVAALSVGLVDGVPLLDLTYEEDSRAQVDMNVVMTGSGRFVEVQATGEGAAFTEEQFERLLALARSGLRQLLERQQAILQLN
ncbi:MAG: ribonuclease PH, partial [Thermoanaerobaculia bacterium]